MQGAAQAGHVVRLSGRCCPQPLRGSRKHYNPDQHCGPVQTLLHNGLIPAQIPCRHSACSCEQMAACTSSVHPCMFHSNYDWHVAALALHPSMSDPPFPVKPSNDSPPASMPLPPHCPSCWPASSTTVLPLHLLPHPLPAPPTSTSESFPAANGPASLK